jgi:hypothetical protein
MEEGGGTSLIDQSGKNNHFILQNTTGATWTSGVKDKAVTLSGNFGKISHNSSLSIPNALSMSAWVMPNSVHRGHVFYKSAAMALNYGLQLMAG